MYDHKCHGHNKINCSNLGNIEERLLTNDPNSNEPYNRGESKGHKANHTCTPVTIWKIYLHQP